MDGLIFYSFETCWIFFHIHVQNGHGCLLPTFCCVVFLHRFRSLCRTTLFWWAGLLEDFWLDWHRSSLVEWAWVLYICFSFLSFWTALHFSSYFVAFTTTSQLFNLQEQSYHDFKAYQATLFYQWAGSWNVNNISFVNKNIGSLKESILHEYCKDVTSLYLSYWKGSCEGLLSLNSDGTIYGVILCNNTGIFPLGFLLVIFRPYRKNLKVQWGLLASRGHHKFRFCSC